MSGKETFIFAKWPVEVHRRPFRRALSVTVKPNQPIRVLAGMGLSQKQIVEFLLSKKDWLEKSFDQFQKYLDQFPQKKIKARETFPFLGMERELKVVLTLHKKRFISLTDENILLHIPRDDWRAGIHDEEHPHALEDLRFFYKREAMRFLLEKVRQWSMLMNLYPSKVVFREQKTRWGSCSSKKIINLNWRLIVFAPELADYVVVHELAHLQHMNHSSHFWALVEKHLPEYKTLRKTLKETQMEVSFLNPN
ncbi:MAG: SprT family zinc-dependent metalloprotease [Bdellovibrio sp.]